MPAVMKPADSHLTQLFQSQSISFLIFHPPGSLLQHSSLQALVPRSISQLGPKRSTLRDLDSQLLLLSLPTPLPLPTIATWWSTPGSRPRPCHPPNHLVAVKITYYAFPKVPQPRHTSSNFLLEE